ncbi:hypothetical protein [Variovorax sp. KK3]|uniref:hypothetical protein n=1 Tax=Variovorax sp. KK3 TaxID=1855728 RepID=UPI00097BD12F|nr:hypothetical protein [Variovorax sp. KK3]
MKKLVPALCLAMALGLTAGCASSRGGGDAGSTAGSGSSGITVFGTIDAGVSNTRNRSSRD